METRRIHHDTEIRASELKRTMLAQQIIPSNPQVGASEQSTSLTIKISAVFYKTGILLHRNEGTGPDFVSHRCISTHSDLHTWPVIHHYQ